MLDKSCNQGTSGGAGAPGQSFEYMSLIPVLDQSIPSSCGHFGGFMWMPKAGDAHTTVGFELVEELCGFPVPDV